MVDSPNFIQVDNTGIVIYALKYKAKGKVIREFFSNKKDYDESISFLKKYWNKHLEILNESIISPLSLV